ncbi:hypothetical protein M432DRAFT_644244 [Thermoascus aurantiacus ATCC 26904]
MSIEEYLVRTDPFRFTTSPNPLPYPLRLRPARSASSRRLKGSIRRYAGSSVLGVSPDTCFLSGTSTRLGIPAVVGTAMGVMSRSRRYVLTFMMMMMVKTQLTFSAIVDDIQSILIFPLNANNGYRDGELNNVAVEVVSPRDCFQPSIFPIPPDDPTVAIYRLVRDEEADATIVVIRLLQIKPMPGRSFRLKMEDDCRPIMGVSIGVASEGDGNGKEEGGGGAGTLGGFVTLKIGDTIYKGILTSYSAVRSSSSKASTHADRHGSSQTRTRVHYLATKDVKETKEDMERLLKALTQRLDKLRQEKHNREIAQRTKPLPDLDDKINDTQAMIDSCLKMLNKVRDMPRELGEVLVSSSGKSVDGKHILDWAFVELSSCGQQRDGDQIFRPNILPRVPESQHPHVHTRDQWQYYIGAGFPARGFRQIITGARYFKCGRTTEITAGVCNGVEAYVHCRWSDSDSNAEADCLRYNDDDLHNRNKVTTKRLSSESSNHCHHYTSEFIILSKKQKTWIDGTPYSQQTSFCAPGDSGSLIIHQDGSICGLLYGEVTGWCGPGDDDTGNLYVGAGVVSCMSKVMASIEQSTIRLDASGNRIAGPAELGLL